MLKRWLGIFAVSSVLLATAGCGTPSKQVSATSQRQKGTPGQRPSGNFQPNFKLTTTPSQVKANSPFTLSISMVRPQHSVTNGGGNTTNHKAFGNSTAGRNGRGQNGGNFGNGTSHANRPTPSMTVVITKGSTKDSVTLTSSNGRFGTFSGKTTLKKSGNYKVTVSMNMGPRTIQKQFTLTVH